MTWQLMILIQTKPGLSVPVGYKSSTMVTCLLGIMKKRPLRMRASAVAGVPQGKGGKERCAIFYFMRIINSELGALLQTLISHASSIQT